MMKNDRAWWKNLNWKLLKKLSLLGVVMGIATVWGWVGNYEGLAWFLLAVICALVIGRKVRRQHFPHGLLAGAIASLIAQIFQVIFFPAYLANSLEHTADFNQLPIDFPPRLLLALLAPFIAAASGIVLGVMSWAAARYVFRSPQAPAAQS